MFNFIKKNKKKVFALVMCCMMLFTFFAITTSAAGVDVVALAANPSEAFIDLLETMFSVLKDLLVSLMNAIKDGFMSLVFVDPLAETLEVSAVGIWLFVMLGLSLALSLGYYIIGILHRRG